MLITPSLVLNTPSTTRRTRLSFLFATVDDRVAGLTSDWLVNGNDTFRVEVRSDQHAIGVGEQSSPPSSEVEKLGPAHCGFVFSLDQKQAISPAFGRLKSALPIRSIGGALGQKVSISGLSPSFAGRVLPHYDDVTLEIAGSKRSVFPLLAVRFKSVTALQRQFKVLNGTMLEDEESLFLGIVVGKVDDILFAAPIADLLDAHNLTFLSKDRITAWNAAARKRDRDVDPSALDAKWDPGTLPPIPEDCMLDKLTSRKEHA